MALDAQVERRREQPMPRDSSVPCRENTMRTWAIVAPAFPGDNNNGLHWPARSDAMPRSMIAHRLQTLRHCDLQLMLRQGRIVVQVPDWAFEGFSNELVLR